MEAELRSNTSTPISVQSPGLLGTALRGCLGSLDGACIEKLLLHCASALESNDVTLAQQVMWVLNNVASALGDPNQRLTSWFLRALISRASRVYPTSMNFNTGNALQRRLMSITELVAYVDLIPWHRFGFCASNSAIFRIIEGYSKVHILDFSITYCMQWPTLVDVLGKRPEGPPSLRITVPSVRPPVPPFLNVSSEEVGLRLANFARSRDVLFELRMIEADSPSSVKNSYCNSLLSKLNILDLDLMDDEALVINCQNWIRYLPEEHKDAFLNIIKGLNPRIIIIVDEDCDLNSSSSLAARITNGFNYLWIPFDSLETFLPKESSQRIEYEADIGYKIENIIGFEGSQRIERLECGIKLSQRMNNIGFSSVAFGEESVKEVKELLDEHASGWGMKQDNDMLVLTWKGHNSVYATAWVPNGYED
ncbi:unnamed protein product [Thlaspi arvense]|uniref:Scarecrow-like protein 32 n=1 Tax=Thlaspi arvense TaxID=13288 RepID=A0AAU9S2U8_THLAR|nr:unnamed protein product [Thlaspi arvense]